MRPPPPLSPSLRLIMAPSTPRATGLPTLDVNRPAHNDDTPLHVAVRSEQDEAVTMLLANGAIPDRFNKFGQNVLHTAVVTKSVAMVVQLLAHEPELALRQSGNGDTALHYAAQSGNVAMVAAIIDGREVTMFGFLCC